MVVVTYFFFFFFFGTRKVPFGTGENLELRESGVLED